jgi:hypothetical protein
MRREGRAGAVRGLVVVALAAASPAAADGVAALCAARGAGEAVCACAARGLAGEVGRDEYALYQRIGFDAERLMARGLAPEAAWALALEAETARAELPGALLRRRAEAARRAHAAHIGWCAGDRG